MTHSTVAFGTFEFDLSTGELRSKGTRVALHWVPTRADPRFQALMRKARFRGQS